MPSAEPRTHRPVPPRALILSFGTLLVPVGGALLFPEGFGSYGPMLWLTALVPAFLLAYYRGWRGAATALAAGMATLSLTDAAAKGIGVSVPDLALGVVVAYVAISLGIGWLAERLHRDRDALEALALTDALTQLPNRRRVRLFLEKEFAAAERGRALSVVVFDLDAFKSFNDRFGHQAGDEALRGFAEVLTATTRKMNLSGRMGGEEFVSVLAATDAQGAVIFADRVRAAMYARTHSGVNVSVSAGVATFQPEIGSPDQLIEAADQALYRAKREGRNRVCLFGGDGTEVGTWDGTGEAGRVAAAPAASAAAPGPPLASQPAVPALPRADGAAQRGRVLLVDEPSVRCPLAEQLARDGFTVVEAGDVASGVRELEAELDVLITDVQLGGASARELIAAAKVRFPLTQVIVLTALGDARVLADAVNAGADRVMFKPIDPADLRTHLGEALGKRDRLIQRMSPARIVRASR